MKKNILFITADQWRGDCLSGLGHPHVKTPNFDALISDGIAFNQHYSVCVPCGPARASLLTGMYLQNHRVTRNGTPLDKRHANIATELRDAGYKPTLFGYTDTTLDPRFNSKEDVLLHGYENVIQGFDEGIILPSENPVKWLDWLAEKGYNFNTLSEAFSSIEFDHKGEVATAGKPLKFKHEHSQTAFLTQHAIEHISNNSNKEDKGWCVHLSYLRPHPPFLAPSPFHRMYDPKSIEPAQRSTKNNVQHPYLNAALSPLGDWPENWIQELTFEANDELYNKETSQIKATYYGLISKVDHYFGALITHLKNIGEYQNTLIILTSDHAELMGDHGLFGKRGFYKESYHIPLIIHNPEQPKKQRGRIENSFTESVDIMPTILDWIGHPKPRQCDGKSLLPFVSGNKSKLFESQWRQEVHWEYEFCDPNSPRIEQLMGIKDIDCKLNVICNNDYLYVFFPSLPDLFYDLKKDPQAKNNCIHDIKYKEIIIKCLQQLLAWRMENDERTLTGYSITRDNIYHLGEIQS